MTSAAFASLAAPVFEDNMELSSSPAGGNNMDEDIDIDFGDYSAAVPNMLDDEHMLDDGELPRPPTATDEMMDDDDTTLVAPINEEEMHDTPDATQSTVVNDDEDVLIDYDDEPDQKTQTDLSADGTTHDTQSTSATAAEEPPEAEEAADEEIVRNPEDSTIEPTPAAVVEVVNEAPSAEPTSEAQAEPFTKAADEVTTAAQEQDSTETAQITETAAEETSGVVGSEEGPAEQAQIEDAQAVDLATQQPDDETAGGEEASLKPMPQIPGTIDTDLRHIPDGPPTPTDTGLHPMTIKFGEHEMPLFKSRAQPTGLLKDDNLASVSLADLIHNCRERLAIKLGEEYVPEGQDLVLNFDHLGMMLFEGSRSASSTSLNDVVDVYLALHTNDGVDDAPPLLLSLQPQPFSTMFDGFKRAAAEGTGMSKFVRTTENGAHDQHDSAEQPADNEGEYEDHEGGEHDQDEGHYEFNFEDGQAENQEEYSEYAQDGEQTYEEGQNPEESHTYDDNAELQHGDYPGPEDDLDQYEDDDATYGEAEQIHEGQPAEEHDPQEVVQPESRASSDTVRGDSANDGTDADAGDGQDDFSAFLEEGAGEDEQYSSTEHQQDQEDEYHDPAEQQTGAEVEIPNDVDDDQAALQDPEDLLNEDFLETAEDGNDLTTGLETYYADNAGEDLLEFAEEETGVQTDNLEQPQEEFDPHEDSEQYHTAFDLLDGTDEANEETAAGEAGGTTNGQAYHDEDDLGFDDNEDQDEANAAAPVVSNSPLGKRSFEEHADDDEFDLEEPDSKKARSG